MDINLNSLLAGAALILAVVFALLGLRKGRLAQIPFVAILFMGQFSGNAPGLAAQETVDASAELFQQPQWLAFKQFWQSLDEVTPNSQFNYCFSIDEEQRQAFQAELESVTTGLDQLTDQGMLQEECRDMLLELSMVRIQYFQLDISFITRMIPSMLDSERTQSLESLERRIDLLVKMRRRGNLDEVETRIILKDLEEQFLKAWVLSSLQLESPYILFYHDPETLEDISITLDTIIEQVQDGSYELYDRDDLGRLRDYQTKFQEKLRIVQELRGAISPLLYDLETP